MNDFDLRPLERIGKTELRAHVIGYASNMDWINQHFKYWEKWNDKADHPAERMLELLHIVRNYGWAMNRRKQCEKIVCDINAGVIPKSQLMEFWGGVNYLSRYTLEDFRHLRQEASESVLCVFKYLWDRLGQWHRSAGTLCFLSKVILMFNWGGSPAFDSRLSDFLKINNASPEVLLRLLKGISEWTGRYERTYGEKVEDAVVNTLKTNCNCGISRIPLGRAVDIVLFDAAGQNQNECRKI